MAISNHSTTPQKWELQVFWGIVKGHKESTEKVTKSIVQNQSVSSNFPTLPYLNDA